MEPKKVLIAGRHFDTVNEAGLGAIRAWQQHHSYCDTLVAVDAVRDKSGALGEPTLTTVPVANWSDARFPSGQRWTPALNTLITEACLRGYEYILYVSTGMRVSEEAVSAMVTFMDGDPNILCVGPHTDKHPQPFSEGLKVLGGATTGWNNCLLWRLRLLAITGFLLVSDGLLSEGAFGVEEVAVTSVQQRLFPPARSVVLGGLPGQYSWDSEGKVLAQVYTKWVGTKFASKAERPGKQLSIMGPSYKLSPGLVWHLRWENFLANGYPWS